MSNNSIDSLLMYYVGRGIISLSDVKVSPEETLMKEIVTKIHPYKITEPKEGAKDQRWYTYVNDKGNSEERKKIRANSRKELYQKLLEYYDEEIKDYKKSSLTMGEFFQEWTKYKETFCKVKNKKKSLSLTTINRYRRDYRNYVEVTELDKMLLKEITSVKLEKALKDIIEKNHLKESFSKNLVGYFKDVFRYAYTDRILNENIFDFVDEDLILSFAENNVVKDDSERVLTREELEALVDACRKHEKKYPYYMPNYAIELAALTGMRAGELSALPYKSINRKTGFLHIDYSEHRIDYEDRQEYVIDEPKNLKHRKFPLTDAILELFDRIEALGLDSEFIFVRKDGTRYTGHDISCACERRAKEAGLDPVRIHKIRRTVASIMLENGVPINTISNLLGHTEYVDRIHYQHDITGDKEKFDAANTLGTNIVPFESRKPLIERVGV